MRTNSCLKSDGLEATVLKLFGPSDGELGSGIKCAMIAFAFASMRLSGIWLFWKFWPLVGSFIGVAKIPARCASVGYKPERTDTPRCRRHSSEKKKKVLSLPLLYSFGIQTGPPMLYPKLL